MHFESILMIKSWVINVKASSKKRKFFIEQGKKANLNFKFFDAVTPSTLHMHDFISDPNIQRTKFARPLLQTEVACALSHISLWKMLIEDKEAKYYCIFEDDTYLDENMSSLISNPKIADYDLIKFSGLKKVPQKKIAEINNVYSLHKLAYGPLDAASYRISKKAAKILINFTYNLTHPIDIMIDRSYDHGIPIHAIFPYPCKTDWHFDKNDPLFTDIGLREYKYEKGTTLFSILKTRYNRIKTSFKKRFAHLRLLFKS